MRKFWLLGSLICGWLLAKSQPADFNNYQIIWDSQSKNSSESMPLGGGDVGLNVWVEDDELLFYFSRSGTFDENNTLLKLGRIRLQISPNPFENGTFRQVLDLPNGDIKITASNASNTASINLWVEVFNPVIHVSVQTTQKSSVVASYENWRYQDRKVEGRANNANSYKWRGKNIITKADQIAYVDNTVRFFHRNEDSTIFDVTVAQQQMESVKDQLYDPLKHLTFGGVLQGKNFISGEISDGVYQNTDFRSWSLKSEKTSKTHDLEVLLYTEQTASEEVWKRATAAFQKAQARQKISKSQTENWWHQYWDRSFIVINRPEKDSIWQTGRNYNLFRYMLGCNAFGTSPTKFNGGLFTYDPVFVDSIYSFTPDHRNWGGGTHTAQNQRLVYCPMLKSGDFELMIPQFDFYLRMLRNAELRSKLYWDHEGACFTEQIENFGLPNFAEYGSKRPEGFDPGLEYNAWLEYQWDTVLEFCLMILESEIYSENEISKYIPLIESSLTFFDQHYQQLAAQRGRKALDEHNQLILYPGSACETYKMAYNATPTITGLKVVLEKLLASPSLPENHGEKWQEMLDRIPPISYQQFEGKTTIAPAKLWERINNTEAPQLYPVFPYRTFGLFRPGFDTALNTYDLDPDVLKFKSHVGWKQYNIWAANLGLADEAAALTIQKLKDSGRRFPAFWGPGFDWVPDHNWGGSGAIGLQDMLLQTVGDSILLFPAWPEEWDVHFKLHAPKNTVIEVKYEHGEIKLMEVSPASRKEDLIILLKGC